MSISFIVCTNTFLRGGETKTPNKQIYIFPSSDLILWYHCWLQYCYLKYTVYHKTEDCRSTIVDQRVQCKCKRYNVRMSVVTDLPHDNSSPPIARQQLWMQARIQKFFKGGGGWGGKFWKIHLSTRVHINTRQTCNSFSLFLFQEDFLLIFALFYYSFFWNLKGGSQPPFPHPPLEPPMGCQLFLERILFHVISDLLENPHCSINCSGSHKPSINKCKSESLQQLSLIEKEMVKEPKQNHNHSINWLINQCKPQKIHNWTILTEN